jgi:DNA-binding transcriptional MerR regulator
MFRRFPFLASAVFDGLTCFDAPDTGAGGGAAPAGGGAAATDGTADPGASAAGAGADGTAGDGGSDDGAAAAGTGDEGDDELPDDSDVAEHLPESQVRTRLRRTQRFLSKTARPVLERLRDPQSGRYYTAEQVDELRQHAQFFREIDPVLAANPKLVEMLRQEQERLRRGDSGATAATADAGDDLGDFDENGFPFDREAPGSDYLLTNARDVHGLKKEVRELRKLLTGVQTERTQDREQQLAGQWKDMTIKAADEVDPAYRGTPSRRTRVCRVYRGNNGTGRVGTAPRGTPMCAAGCSARTDRKPSSANASPSAASGPT